MVMIKTIIISGGGILDDMKGRGGNDTFVFTKVHEHERLKLLEWEIKLN